MDNPLHAEFYADSAVQRTVRVLEHVQTARDTYRVRFACPEIAATIVPGQFLMLRLAGWNDPLIGRPLAVYDVHAGASGGYETLDVVYLAKGKFTSRLASMEHPGELTIWGPLGNGFAAKETEHLVMVAGGIGQTPFLALAQEHLGIKRYGKTDRSTARAKKITFCYGARSADCFAGLEDFERLGIEIILSTDDGSRGRRGLVTESLRETLDRASGTPRIVCCGPEPMMEAVAHLAHERKVACEVSLETPMACGIGICFTCVASIKQDDGTCDYKRTCVEGPVFDASRVEW